MQKHRTSRIIAIVIMAAAALYFIVTAAGALLAGSGGAGLAWGTGWRGWLVIPLAITGFMGAISLFVFGAVLYFLGEIASNTRAAREQALKRQPAARAVAPAASAAAAVPVVAAVAAPPAAEPASASAEAGAETAGEAGLGVAGAAGLPGAAVATGAVVATAVVLGDRNEDATPVEEIIVANAIEDEVAGADLPQVEIEDLAMGPAGDEGVELLEGSEAAELSPYGAEPVTVEGEGVAPVAEEVPGEAELTRLDLPEAEAVETRDELLAAVEEETPGFEPAAVAVGAIAVAEVAGEDREGARVEEEELAPGEAELPKIDLGAEQPLLAAAVVAATGAALAQAARDEEEVAEEPVSEVEETAKAVVEDREAAVEIEEPIAAAAVVAVTGAAIAEAHEETDETAARAAVIEETTEATTGDLEVSDLEVSDLEVGDLEVGDLEVAAVVAEPQDEAAPVDLAQIDMGLPDETAALPVAVIASEVLEERPELYDEGPGALDEVSRAVEIEDEPAAVAPEIGEEQAPEVAPQAAAPEAVGELAALRALVAELNERLARVESGTQTGAAAAAAQVPASPAEPPAESGPTQTGATQHLPGADETARIAAEIAAATPRRRGAGPTGPQEDAASPKSDDFGLITGVGPTYAQRLHERGIRTYADLADASYEVLDEVTNGNLERVLRQDWRGQARRFSQQKPKKE